MAKVSDGYRHHVFLSYSRAQAWPTWIDDCFLPSLRHWLGEDLSGRAEIFVDHSITIGQPWKVELRRALARSRTIIPLLSGTYLSSEWCLEELSTMLARMDGLRARDLDVPVIFPVAIHDSDPKHLPRMVADLQVRPFHEWANPQMAEKGPVREGLWNAVRQLSAEIAPSIEAIPDNSFEWPSPAHDRYLRALRVKRVGQTRVPSLGRTS